jgi:hypothetical protein
MAIGIAELSEEEKRNFLNFCECDLNLDALGWTEIDRKGIEEKILTIDFPDPRLASRFWGQRRLLVSAARHLNLSRDVLFSVRGKRYGLAQVE